MFISPFAEPASFGDAVILGHQSGELQYLLEIQIVTFLFNAKSNMHCLS